MNKFLSGICFGAAITLLCVLVMHPKKPTTISERNLVRQMQIEQLQSQMEAE